MAYDNAFIISTFDSLSREKIKGVNSYQDITGGYDISYANNQNMIDQIRYWFMNLGVSNLFNVKLKIGACTDIYNIAGKGASYVVQEKDVYLKVFFAFNTYPASVRLRILQSNNLSWEDVMDLIASLNYVDGNFFETTLLDPPPWGINMFEDSVPLFMNKVYKTTR